MPIANDNPKDCEQPDLRERVAASAIRPAGKTATGGQSNPVGQMDFPALAAPESPAAQGQGDAAGAPLPTGSPEKTRSEQMACPNCGKPLVVVPLTHATVFDHARCDACGSGYFWLNTNSIVETGGAGLVSEPREGVGRWHLCVFPDHFGGSLSGQKRECPE